MYTTYAELLSLLFIIVYLYKKTKDKIPLWILVYILFLVSSAKVFRMLYPHVPFFSPTFRKLPH